MATTGSLSPSPVQAVSVANSDDDAKATARSALLGPALHLTRRHSTIEFMKHFHSRTIAKSDVPKTPNP